MSICKIEDEKITLCKELNHLTNIDNKFNKETYIIVVDIPNMDKEYLGAISYRYGRKKNDILGLSFCPVKGFNHTPVVGL